MIREAPEQIETARLLLRRPRLSDADAVFSRYASDPDVTRYLSWPRHRSVDDTRAFLAYSDAEWARWRCGPYLILDKAECQRPEAGCEVPPKRERGANSVTRVRAAALLGSTGLAFETPTRAMTGYVLAKDAWGVGYATEALNAMVNLARDLGVKHLVALCNADHRPSWRVLEKGGLVREAEISQFEFPNLAPGRFDTFTYSINL